MSNIKISGTTYSVILPMPERIDYSSNSIVEVFHFADDTYGFQHMGKKGDIITLTGKLYGVTGGVPNAYSKVSFLNLLMDTGEDVSVTSLPDTDLNTIYKITDLSITAPSGIPKFYEYKLSLERKYDRLG